MTRTVFFDLDGTLTDPKEGITRSIQYALEKLGVGVPEADELTWCIGPPLIENFRTLVGPDRAPKAVAYYRERFARVGLYENAPYPGIHETLTTLGSAGFRLCVASSKPHVFVTQILEHFGLTAYFSDVFGSELDGTRNDKTELLRFAISKTNSIARETMMVGDRKYDIIGAIDNSITPIAVQYGYGSIAELTAAGATRFARTPADLVPLLAQAGAD